MGAKGKARVVSSSSSPAVWSGRQVKGCRGGRRKAVHRQAVEGKVWQAWGQAGWGGALPVVGSPAGRGM